MGVFGVMMGAFGGSMGSVFMIIVLVVADYLWGENVFSCPCGDYRVLYTCSFLVVPPVVIIVMDTSWRVLFTTCQVCCDEFNGRCKRCCCCSRKTCETIARLFVRPIIIACIWLVVITMEPKFARCMFEDISCNCTKNEVERFGCTPETKRNAALLRVIMASFCLALACLAIVLGLLYILCKCCCRCFGRICCYCCWRYKTYCRACSRDSVHHADVEKSESQRDLSRCLYTIGIEPKTMIRLQEGHLVSENRLMNLSDFLIRDISRSVDNGQGEILKNHLKYLRVVGWLLKENYTKPNVKTIVDKAMLLEPVIDDIRESLNKTGRVVVGQKERLEHELRQKGLGHLVPRFSSEDIALNTTSSSPGPRACKDNRKILSL